MSTEPVSDEPRPSETPDASLADPPTTEAAAESDQPHRTPGLGNALADPKENR